MIIIPRDANDLKALVMAGDEYTETANIEYMGEMFAIEIRPLTEAELTDVSRMIKLNAKMLKTVADKVKTQQQAAPGKDLSEAERKKLQEDAVDAVLASEGTVDIGDMAAVEYLQNKEYCRRGIVDPGLRDAVPKFRYGLTELISKRIQTISNVPPPVVANFFGQTKGN